MSSLKLAQRIDELANLLSPKAAAAALARSQAIAEISNMVRTEAYVMAYSDCFFIIGIALIIAALALFLVPKLRRNNAAAV